MPTLPLLLLASAAASPALVHGGPQAPQAWAALARGQAWVCWREAPDCWRRVALELAEPGGEDDVDLARADELELDEFEDLDEFDDLDALDDEAAGFEHDPSRHEGPAEPRRFAFLGADRLVLVDALERAWTVSRADPVPQRFDDEQAIAAQTPLVLACSPTGRLPVLDAEGWSWRLAPCAPARACSRTAVVLPRLRAAGVSLSLSLALTLGRGRHRTRELEAPALDRDADVSVWLLAALGFDARRAFARRTQWASLAQARRRASERGLPPVPAGPLASAETDALARALCRGGEP